MDRYANLCVPIFNFKGTLYLHLSINWHKSIVLKKELEMQRMTAEWREFFLCLSKFKKQKCEKVTLQEVKKWKASSRNTFFVYLICLFVFSCKRGVLPPHCCQAVVYRGSSKGGGSPSITAGSLPYDMLSSGYQKMCTEFFLKYL